MPFEPIARFYDQDDGRLQEDIPTVLAFAQKTGGPVLELGVGTGRLALPLARAGFEVVGVESAAAMLAIARQRLHEQGCSAQVTLVQADFTRLELGRRFGLAYCGFNSFLHLVETSAQLEALTCWRAHLRPQGLLVLDVENPQIEHLAAANLSLTFAEQWVDETTGRTIQKFEAGEVQLADQVYVIHRLYDEIGSDGVVRRTTITWRTRILFRRELELLLLHAGYHGLEFYGDHEMSPWEPGSPRIIAVARP